MKKYLSLAVISVLVTSIILSGCGKNNTKDAETDVVSTEVVTEEKENLDNHIIDLAEFVRKDTEEGIELSLTWNGFVDVDGYEICYVEKYENEDDWRTEVIERVDEASYSFYYQDEFYVKAKVRAYKSTPDGDIYSPWSNEVTGNSLIEVTEKLPIYRYDGDNIYEEAISSYMSTMNKEYYDGELLIPVILTEKIDDSDIIDTKVYGNFWTFGLDRVGHTLILKSSGRESGMFVVSKNDAGYDVTSVEMASDGANFDSDLLRICNDDKNLYSRICNLDYDNVESLLITFLSNYVNKNGLYIDRYRDVDGREIFLLNAADFDELEINATELDRTPALSELESEKTDTTYIINVEAEEIPEIDGYEFYLSEEKDGEVTERYLMQEDKTFSYPIMENETVNVKVRAYKMLGSEISYSNWSNQITYNINEF